MPAISLAAESPAGESQPRLVDERGRRQRVITPLPLEAVRSDPLHIGIRRLKQVGVAPPQPKGDPRNARQTGGS